MTAMVSANTSALFHVVGGEEDLPALVDYELRAITPMLVEDLRAKFDQHGVGVQTQRKALMLLQGILRRAVVRGLIPANPVSVVDRPRQPPTCRPEPLPPLIVERIRGQLSQRDGTRVSALAYAGLWPDEATSAGGANWGEGAAGARFETERPRTIKLLAPFVQDVAEADGMGRPPPNATPACPTTSLLSGLSTPTCWGGCWTRFRPNRASQRTRATGERSRKCARTA